MTSTSLPLSRRNLLVGAAGIAVLASCGSRAGDTQAATTPAPSPTGARTATGAVPSLDVVSRARSGRVERWRLRTDALAHETGVNVLLPAGYDASPTRRYPVVYLLHGSKGSADWWLNGLPLADIVGRSEVIVVMPDGGRQGWYLDWASQATAARWESFHLRTLVPAVDANYRTIATREGRAVAGASMGGFGAVHYAQAYPELFVTASSYSGAVSLRTPQDFLALDASLIDDKPPYAIFGTSGAAARAAHVDPAQNLGLLAGRNVRLYSGNAVTPTGTDQMESIMLGCSRLLRDRAKTAGITVPLTIVPGVHDFATWRTVLALDLPAMLKVMTAAR